MSSDILACSVCLENMAGSGSVSSLRCGHVFHRLCITKWACGSNPMDFDCPMCREGASLSEELRLKLTARRSAYPSADARIRALKHQLTVTEAAQDDERRCYEVAVSRLLATKAQLAILDDKCAQESERLSQLEKKLAARPKSSAQHDPLGAPDFPTRACGGRRARGDGGRLKLAAQVVSGGQDASAGPSTSLAAGCSHHEKAVPARVPRESCRSTSSRGSAPVPAPEGSGVPTASVSSSAGNSENSTLPAHGNVRVGHRRDRLPSSSPRRSPDVKRIRKK